jgi:hypothetical protein
MAYRRIDRVIRGEVVACSCLVLFTSEVVRAFAGKAGKTSIYEWVSEARTNWTADDWKEIEPFMPAARKRTWPLPKRWLVDLDAPGDTSTVAATETKISMS